MTHPTHRAHPSARAKSLTERYCRPSRAVTQVTPQPTPRLCVLCGKPIHGGFRKLGSDKWGKPQYSHLSCPKETERPYARRVLFVNVFTGLAIR